MGRLDFNFGGVRQQRADDEARTVAERVHSQQGVGRLVRQFNQAAQLIFGQQHDNKRLTGSAQNPNADYSLFSFRTPS
jgi:hypothetical protein